MLKKQNADFADFADFHGFFVFKIRVNLFYPLNPRSI